MSIGTRRLVWLAATALLLGAAPLSAETGLQAFTAKYRVSRGNLVVGNAEISLQITASGDYVYQGLTTPSGLVAVFRSDEITEISKGTITEKRIIPSDYHYLHKKRDETRKVDLSFDWKSRSVTNAADNTQWSMEIPPNTQDKFSLQLALMQEVARGMKSVSFEVADGGLLKTYQFSQQKRGRLELPVGEVEAVQYQRNKEDRPSQVSLWLAPSLNYLPVRIEKEKKGRFIMELTSVEWGNRPAATPAKP